MRAYVFGGSGFIGKAVSQALKLAGHEPVVVSSRKPASSLPYDWFHSPGYLEMPRDAGSSVAVHLAEGNVVHGVDDGFAEQLARRIAGAGFKWTVYASSAAVYGDLHRSSHDESEIHAAPGSYGRRKLACEKVFLETQRATILRLANVYGPGMSKANVLSAILAGWPDSGCPEAVYVERIDPVRCYVHVDDVARAFVAALETCHNEIFNVTSGEGVSVEQLGRILANVRGCVATAILPRKTGGNPPSCLITSPAKAKAVLGWQAEIGLADGLRRFSQGEKS